MSKIKVQEQHICISTFNVMCFLIPFLLTIFSIAFFIYIWVNSSLSSLEKNLDNNLKDISKEMTTIKEQTKDISNIRDDVHAMLYNERKTQGDVVKSLSPQLEGTLNSDALARYSLEKHISPTEFNLALEILKAKPLVEAKAALKEKNLFNDSQIQAIFSSEKKSD